MAIWLVTQARGHQVNIDIKTINSRKKRRGPNQESASRREHVENEVDASPRSSANLDPALSDGRNLFYQSDVTNTSSDDDSLEVVEERPAPISEPDFDLNDAFTESSTVVPTSIVDLSTQYSRDDVTTSNQAEPSMVDLEAAEQQVIEITDDEEGEEDKENEEGSGITGREDWDPHQSSLRQPGITDVLSVLTHQILP